MTIAKTAPQAFVFPGQGAQIVGMGRRCAEAFSEAAEVFEAADRALGFELSALCWNGPQDQLGQTANTQPAILTASIAVARVLRARGHFPKVVAGHSLGEYSALVTADCIDFEDAVRLVRRRGELMQDAVPVGVGAMAAIIGLPADELGEIVAAVDGAKSRCAVANLNAPGQTVISGHSSAVEEAMGRAKAAGAKRALRLAVSAPFHSPLMRPAREGLEPCLRAMEFRDPAVPVITNVDAEAATTAAAVRSALQRQIDQPVRWVESVGTMTDSFGIESFVEIGPGRVLSGLIRRISKGATTHSISDPEGVEQFLSG